MPSKIDTILMSLSDTEVELLIRKYVGKMQKRMKPETHIGFSVRSKAYEAREQRGYWTVGNQYGSTNSAEGEILAETVNEHNRRIGFKSSLLLIESETGDILDAENC